jgi:23S rRNA pseudouridine2604 synthase
MKQNHKNPTEGISLNKYISSSGFCSRREADKYIEQARVTINNELAQLTDKVYSGDNVAVDGEPLRTKVKPIYIALNKPAGITSTTDLKDKSNIISYIGHPKRLFPIGRLDKDSTGLIFLTNDGDIVNKILRAGNRHEKEYVVRVNKAITPEFIKKMGNGVPILGTITQPCFIRQEGNKKFRIILTQGLNRQIRRMCEFLTYEVEELMRVRIMNISLGNLAIGKWRYLTDTEISQLNKLMESSSGTEEASYIHALKRRSS